MKDTISRQMAIDALRDGALINYQAAGHHNGLVKAIDVIKGLPSVPSEIIRCKDCQYYQDNNNGYPHMNCKWDANETPDADDFCSGAERRK